MGFYIHSCKKMRYKGEYEPSELLCPTALDWHPYKESVTLLEKNKFSPLNQTFVAEFEAVLEKEKVDKINAKNDDKNIDQKHRKLSTSESGDKNENKNKDDKNKRKKSKENKNEIENKIDSTKDSSATSDDDKPNLMEVMETSPFKIFSPRFSYSAQTTPSSPQKTKNKDDHNFTDSHITDLDRKEISLIPIDLGDGKIE